MVWRTEMKCHVQYRGVQERRRAWTLESFGLKVYMIEVLAFDFCLHAAGGRSTWAGSSLLSFYAYASAISVSGMGRSPGVRRESMMQLFTVPKAQVLGSYNSP